MEPPLPSMLKALILPAVLVVAALMMSGCQAVALAGVMADTFEKTGSHKVYPEYEGLRGKTFAVVIAADRVVQGNDPRLVVRLTNGITRKLAESKDVHGSVGYVPGPRVLELQYNKPRWTTWSYSRLADEFGVDRLIYVELGEYRLGEPGNAHLWNAVASAHVGVVEADAEGAGDSFSYTKDVRVTFPDESGVTTTERNRGYIQANLEERLADRVAWLFFEHEEPNKIKY